MAHPLIYLIALILLVTLQMINEVICMGKPEALFVFGDSFVDCGNTKPTDTSWQRPYGVTYPGEPTGRWSDGWVWSDFVANFLGLESPVPYEKIDGNPGKIKNGVNFAYGGSGLFQTIFPYPNMTQQIDFFETMIRRKYFTNEALASSVALLAPSGNDYTKFALDKPNATPLEWESFIERLIDQLMVNVKRIQGVGVNAIGIDGLSPLGCFPVLAMFNFYIECNKDVNYASEFHNLRLKQGISKLNETTPGGYVYLDLYNAFLAVIKERDKEFDDNQLKSCCKGVAAVFKCGALNKKGRKLYLQCNNPKKLFYWDNEHPSQQGWNDIHLYLNSSLGQLRNNIF